jgi:FMN reductase
MHITSISGSPSERSRSAWLTQFALTRLEGVWTQSHHIALRELPAAALLGADARDAAIAEAVEVVGAASLVIVGTPIYKAAYSGLLKVFLDLLPPDALRGKTVLPLATGGSPAHLLALDYALKPVLSALKAQETLQGIFADDSQIAYGEGNNPAQLADALQARLLDSLETFHSALARRPKPVAPGELNERLISARWSI